MCENDKIIRERILRGAVGVRFVTTRKVGEEYPVINESTSRSAVSVLLCSGAMVSKRLRRAACPKYVNGEIAVDLR